MSIDDILTKYGFVGRTGRVRFNQYAYILIAKKLGLKWHTLTDLQRIILKGDMIDQWTGMGYVRGSGKYYLDKQ